MSRGKARGKANFFVDYFCYLLQLMGVLVWELHRIGQLGAIGHMGRIGHISFRLVFFPLLIWLQDGGLELLDLFGRGRADFKDLVLE